MKRRLIALLLVFILVMTSGITVFAETAGDTVTNVNTEETEAVENTDGEDPSEETSATEEASNLEINTADAKGQVLVGGGVPAPVKVLVKVSIKIVVEATIDLVEGIKYATNQDEAITLSGVVYFDEDTELPPIIVGDGGLTIAIKDGVTVTIDATKEEDGKYAGIRVEDPNSPLIITPAAEKDEADPKGTGKLVVKGGDGSAAIGGKSCNKGGYTTIEGCTVYAYGGDDSEETSGGAGIGGGSGSVGENITINGGTVYAYGGENAAGIGSGARCIDGDASNITINGGTVYAYGKGDDYTDDRYGGAGIGGGLDFGASNIKINEIYGTTYVEAHGAGTAAGIGSGGHESTDHQAHDITITGGTVRAYGSARPDKKDRGGAGIGSGYYHKAYNISITGGDVEAYGYGGAAGIGGGSKASGMTKDITISGGKVKAVSVYNSDSDGNGAGIGSGEGSNATCITISNATVEAISQNEGAGIGSGSGGNLKADSYGINISNSSITAESKDGGAGIGAGYKGNAENIWISGASTNIVATANNGAGIGGGSGGKAEDIKIDDGDIKATSNGIGAGIGSGKGGTKAENIHINGGHVLAQSKGAQKTNWGEGSGCGIGVGYFDSNKTEPNDDITINTLLDAKYYSYENSEWNTLYNNGGDLAHSSGSGNFMKRSAVEIITGSKTKGITLGEQTGAPTYGTESVSNYDLTANYVTGNDWEIKWYKNGKAITEAPAEFSVSADMSTAYLEYTGDADAGTYTFTVTCDGVTSNEATYTVNKKAATITSGSATKVYDGTPLTCETYEVSGFVDGEGVEVTCTGSCTGSAEQTEPTTADNTFTYKALKGTNLDNYTITETKGTLTVIKQLFVISAENYKSIYDGKSHTFSAKVIAKNGVDVTSIATLSYATSTDGNNWSEFTENVPSIKNAGKLFVKVKATATISGNPATIESDVYTMEVTKKSVTLTSESKTKEYDGTALTYSDLTYGALAGGESFGTEPVATGTITKVGSAKNTINTDGLKVKSGSVDTTDNYIFTTNEGTLTVTPKSTPIVIKTLSNSKTYDGNAIDAGTASWTDGVLVNGERLEVKLDKTGTGAVRNAGTYDNDIAEYHVFDPQGEDVTNCYTFAEPVIGTLTINKRRLTLTSGSDLKVKTAATDYAENTTVNATGDGLLAGEGLTYSGFKKVTEVSYTPTENTFTYAAASGSQFDADNYDITVENGYLMLVEEMSIIGEDQTFTYDGTNHLAPVTLVDNAQGAAVEIVYSTSTDNKTWTEYTTTTPSLKNAGTLYIKAKATKGLQVKEASYTLTVEKREVTIESDSASKSYDGTELTCEGYTIGGDGFVLGEGVLSANYEGAQLDPGESENSFSYMLMPNTDEDNYTITQLYGTLKVTKDLNPIVITTGSDSWTYNGMALSCNDYDVTWGGTKVNSSNILHGNDVLQVVSKGSITDVGTVVNECDYKVVRNGVDVTDNYTFEEPVCGTLEVTPRAIKITTGSAEKVYDGTALTCDKYTITGDGFAEGEGIASVNIVGTRTNAGTAKNALDETTPYTFKYGTNINNYEVTTEIGTLTVDKRKVTVTSGSAVATWVSCSKDGLSNKVDCTVTGDGFVSGEATPKGSTVLAKPGSEPAVNNPVIVDNAIEYNWTGNGNPANYDITENLGKLAIINNSATTAVAQDYVGVYDGKAHTGTFSTSIQESYTTEYSTDDKETWSEKEPTFTDVTNGTKTVYVKVTAEGGSTAQCSYTVTITPRDLTLTAGSAEKVYDGKALTCSDYIIGGEGFANEQEKADAAVKTSGTITDVGTDKNKIVELTDNGSFKASNYNIAYDNGTLKVTKRSVTMISVGFAREYESIPEEIVITKGDYAGTYDLNPITYDGKWHSREAVVEVGTGQVQGIATIENMGFAGDEGVDYDDFAEIKDAGLYENTFSYTAKAGTNLNNYDIKCIYGLMRIKPCEVTITTANDAKMYDGDALTNNNFTVTTSLDGNAMPDGEKVYCDVTGSQTNVGKSANTFDYVITNSKDINYTVTMEEGVLEVYDSDTLRIVVPDNKEYVYDGKAHGDAAKAYIGDDPCDETIWYSIDGGTTYTDVVPQLTEAGTLKVMAYVEKNGYVKAEGTYTITVTKAADKQSTDTGDHNDIGLWIILTLTSMLTLAGTALKRRKYN